MNSKFIALFIALAFLAACETPTAGSGAASATGASGAGGGAVTSGAGTSAVSTGPAALQQQLVQIGDRVYFAFDSYTLSPEARAVVERQAAFLLKHPDVQVVINGHTDNRGTREYNLALGARRAGAVKDQLVVLGVAPNRITTVSYGEERPAVVGSNEQAWAKNRRAVTVIAGARVGS